MAAFWEGEAPAEPTSPARREPRPPGQGRDAGRIMDDSVIALKQELADLRVRLATRDAELSRWRQQYLIVNSLWTSLQQSRLWKLSAPLRSLRRWSLPRGFDQDALIPWQQLQW